MSLDIGLYARVELADGEKTDLDVGESLNVTHNLVPMWEKAGVYDALYLSDGEHAKDYLGTLRRGLELMEDNAVAFRELNPENRWGNYAGALSFLRRWITLCARYPRALIRVSR